MGFPYGRFGVEVPGPLDENDVPTDLLRFADSIDGSLVAVVPNVGVLQDQHASAPVGSLAIDLAQEALYLKRTASSWGRPLVQGKETVQAPIMSNVTLGNGSVNGGWKWSGEYIEGWFLLSRDSTTTFTTSPLYASIPIVPEDRRRIVGAGVIGYGATYLPVNASGADATKIHFATPSGLLNSNTTFPAPGWLSVSYRYKAHPSALA